MARMENLRRRSEMEMKGRKAKTRPWMGPGSSCLSESLLLDIICCDQLPENTNVVGLTRSLLLWMRLVVISVIATLSTAFLAAFKTFS